MIGKFLVHEIPLVRSITLWTLSRLANYIVFESEICGIVISSALVRMEDKNKAVQQAAISAIAGFVEAGGLVGEWGTEIAKIMTRCIGFYQTRNLVTLMDAVGHFVGILGGGGWGGGGDRQTGRAGVESVYTSAFGESQASVYSDRRVHLYSDFVQCGNIENRSISYSPREGRYSGAHANFGSARSGCGCPGSFDRFVGERSGS